MGENDVRTVADGMHEDILITRKNPHPQFNNHLYTNDVAVLALQRHVTFTGISDIIQIPRMLIDFNFICVKNVDRIRVVCLPIEPHMQTLDFVKSNPFVTGWGITSIGSQPSPYLKQLQVPVIHNSLCKEIYRKAGLLRSEDHISKMNVCAGFKAGESSCKGISKKK